MPPATRIGYAVPGGRRPLHIALIALIGLLSAPAAAQEAKLSKIPLVVGTMMVRAHESPQGDLEEIRVVQAAGPDGVLISRSAEVMLADGRIERVSGPRFIATEDRRNARTYAFAIVAGEPERQPGTTAIGLSAALYDELATKRVADAKFGFGPEPTDVVIRHMGGRESIEVLLKGDLRIAPAFRTSTISRRPGQITAFATWYLDDRDNPLSLHNESSRAPDGSTRSSQLVAVNTFDVALRQQVYEALALGRGTALYGFHFELGGSRLREESVFALKLLAAVLRDLPGTRIAARVHTDAADGPIIITEARAATIKAVLEKELPEAAGRVEWSAAGAAEPAMRGDTLVSRAANRRVTLRPL
jgi:outer membrane protein OmpA-like peptidoglycan-associated protein